ncbi:MAG: CDP-alcohol phosphatidyltransferase family protein [Bacteroidetes bacterium]|nr:CDP-alcohol phosphatidyltransferase family protein [Bacteroidota bacterium]MCH8941584.1 CDP-alcohol phosphatidyltransferase family protein [Bacteroidota bacterium]
MKINYHELFSTKSNLLSFFRALLAIPLWILFDHFNTSWATAILFSLCILVVITDLLDGYLARKFNEVTEMGKIIDPLADKVVVTAIIIKIYLLDLIPYYYFFMIIGRDLIIFLGGIYIANKIGKVLPSNKLGKATVFIIGIVILLIILKLSWNNSFLLLFYYLSIILIFISLLGYIYRGYEYLKENKTT